MDVQLANIWVAAGIILGFEVTWFTWRISREVKMAGKRERTWLPPADIVNLIAMVVIAIGVFILPILGLIDIDLVKRLFALAVLIFVGYPFALAGHYQLFSAKRKEKQTRCSFQERIVLLVIAALTVIYIVLWAIIG